MKKTIWMAIAALILMAAPNTAAQSLGDYARKVRKNKPPSSTTSHYYDNDNLPTKEGLSVVGPEPAAAAAAGQGAAKTAPDEAAAKADRQKAADDLQEKITKQKEKLDALTHQLDLDQREYRLRAAVFYSDAGLRLRDSAQWDKEDAQYKADIDSKQKAIDAAKQELEDLQEQARKAGMKDAGTKEKENDKDKDK